ncbi:MAG TPA: hypothetical protein VGM05_30300 [Planctomycetaceae bacterium]
MTQRQNIQRVVVRPVFVDVVQLRGMVTEECAPVIEFFQDLF